MNRRRVWFTILLVCALAGQRACAQPLSTAAAQLGAGTGGVGISFTAPLIPQRLNLNTGFSGADIGFVFDASGGHFKADAFLGGVPLTLSYFPFGGGFNLDMGFIVNLNNVKVTGRTTTGPYVLDGVTYTVNQVEKIQLKTHFNTVAPYVGVGWGNPVAPGSRWRFIANLGAMYEGKPGTTLTMSTMRGNPIAMRDIARAQQEINGKLEFLDWWPIVTFGVAYRF